MQIRNPELIPLSLYMHFPWCIKKCPYCDFNSHTLKDTLPEKAYVDILTQHLLDTLPWIQQRPIRTIFLGGGTPSLFSAQSLAPLFETLAKHCHLPSDIEITLEANPSTVEQARFKDYRQLGINRISLGIQSFQDTYLKRLGRVHDSLEAQRAIGAVQDAGFERFNLDLMFGLPHQTPEDAANDLTMALSFSPPHLSWYELTLEPNTPFAHQPPPLPSEGHLAEIQSQGQCLLHEAGFQQYEVSAYALSPDNANSRGGACRHNMNYWEFGDYIAIGAGGHGKITLSPQEILRYQHVKHPKQYMDPNLPFIQESHVLSDSELPFEYFLNTLRLRHGAPTAYFTARTGLPLSAIESTLEKLVQKGWLEPIDDRIKTTALGFRFLNNVTEAFLTT